MLTDLGPQIPPNASSVSCPKYSLCQGQHTDEQSHHLFSSFSEDACCMEDHSNSQELRLSWISDRLASLAVKDVCWWDLNHWASWSLDKLLSEISLLLTSISSIRSSAKALGNRTSSITGHRNFATSWMKNLKFQSHPNHLALQHRLQLTHWDDRFNVITWWNHSASAVHHQLGLLAISQSHIDLLKGWLIFTLA